MPVKHSQDRIDPFDNYHTIEYKGSKGWEVARTFNPNTFGLFTVSQKFCEIVVNDREQLQWRLTTAKVN